MKSFIRISIFGPLLGVFLFAGRLGAQLDYLPVASHPVSSDSLKAISRAIARAPASLALSGNVVVTSSAGTETHPITLTVDPEGATRLQITGSSALGPETWPAPGDIGACTRQTNEADRQEKGIGGCLTTASWVMPTLALSNPKTLGRLLINSSEISSVSGNQILLRVSIAAATLGPTARSLLQRISERDIYLDPKTLLPQRLVYLEHRAGSSSTSRVQTEYSDYRPTSGVMLPYHIQRRSQSGQSLDITLVHADVTL